MSIEQFNHAIRLIQVGQKESAREILTELVQLEPHHVSVWMWLAEAMPNDEQCISVLETCLKLNPESLMAKRGIERFREHQALLGKLSSIENAATEPIPKPYPPEPSPSSSSQRIPPVVTPPPMEPAQPRLPSEEPLLKPIRSKSQPVHEFDTLRESLMEKETLPKVKSSRVPQRQAEPPAATTSISYDQAQVEPSRQSKARVQDKPEKIKKPPLYRQRQSRTPWVCLVLLGLCTALVVAMIAYIKREPLLAWLEKAGIVTTSRVGRGVQTTPWVDELSAQMTQTQLGPMATLTPTPTVTPVPSPTATVAFSFTYPIIVPALDQQLAQVIEFSSSPVLSLAFSPDNRMLATGLVDGTVIVWDLATQDVSQIFKGQIQPVHALAFSPDHRYLVSGSDEGKLQLLDLDARKEVSDLSGHIKAIKSIAFSPDGILFASGSEDGILNLWQLGSDQPASTIPVEAGVTCLNFAPDGRLMAYGLQTGDIMIWDIAAGSVLKTLRGHTDTVSDVEFAPNGHRLASGSADRSVKLWDVDTGKVMYTIGSHTDSVLSVSFSPDGRLLASSSLGQAIKIWDVAKRHEIANLRHTQNMPMIAFSPDGRVLAAALSPIDPGSKGGGVVLWGVPSSPEVVQAPAKLTIEAMQAGDWSPGGSMAIPRAAHKVVVIAGGNFLILGGVVAGSQAGSAEELTHKVELYDPISGTSSFTGSMNAGAGAPSTTTATLLMDGRVLVVGNYNSSQVGKASAEIYDPVSGSWSMTEPLFNHGSLHTATLLSDGRVLVVGGCEVEGEGGASMRAELFEPSTNAWVETESLTEPRCGHTGILLGNGYVLIAGGVGADGEFLSSALIYNPNIGQWLGTGDMKTPRAEAASVLMTNERVLVTGGLAKSDENTVTINSVEIYDPDTGEWKAAEPMLQARYGHSITRLSTGLVLVAGGVQVATNIEDIYLGDVEVFDPITGVWTYIATLDTPRAFHAAAFLPNGHLLVLGGMQARGGALASTEVLIPGIPSPADTPGLFPTQPVEEITPTPVSSGSLWAPASSFAKIPAS